jgi:hypothetical protein
VAVTVVAVIAVVVASAAAGPEFAAAGPAVVNSAAVRNFFPVGEETGMSLGATFSAVVVAVSFSSVQASTIRSGRLATALVTATLSVRSETS